MQNRKISKTATATDRLITRRPVGGRDETSPAVQPDNDKVAKTRMNPKLFERKLTAQELADGIDAYFQQCEERNRKPTKPGLCTYLGISTSTWDNWGRYARENEAGGASGGLNSRVTRDKYSEFTWAMKKAEQRMSDELQQRTDTMAVFLLKQPCYGGYTDRTDGATGGGALSVNITFGETHKSKSRNFGK